MMIHAYDKDYLYDLADNLGECLDYAVNICKYDIDEFNQMIIHSGIYKEIENCNPKYIAGMSGTELAAEVIQRTDKESFIPDNWINYDRSEEYWSGWTLAHLQWYTDMPFDEINTYLKMSEIQSYYSTLHEATIEKTYEVLRSIIAAKITVTNLKRIRTERGLTQKELSILSGVNLRTLQQYENKSKDINKASLKTVYALSKILWCDIEDLIEYTEL